MFSKDKIIVGLEVGTSKVCAVVGEVPLATVRSVALSVEARAPR